MVKKIFAFIELLVSIGFVIGRNGIGSTTGFLGSKAETLDVCGRESNTSDFSLPEERILGANQPTTGQLQQRTPFKISWIVYHPYDKEPFKKQLEDIMENATRILNMYISSSKGDDQDFNMIIHLKKSDPQILGQYANAIAFNQLNSDIYNKFVFSKEQNIFVNENYLRLAKAYKTPQIEKLFCKVLVHEIFHGLRFCNIDFDILKKEMEINDHIFKSKEDKAKLALMLSKEGFIDSSHWRINVNPNDIMVTEPVNKALVTSMTLYTLRLLNDSIEINLENADKDPLDENVSSEKGKNTNVWDYKCDDDKPSDHPAFCSKKDKKFVKCNYDFTAKTVCLDTMNNYGCYPRVELMENSCMNEKALELIWNAKHNKSQNSGHIQLPEPFEVFNMSSRCYEDIKSEKAYCLGTKILDSTAKPNADLDKIEEKSPAEIQVSYYDKNIYKPIDKNTNEKFFTIVKDQDKIDIKYPEIVKFIRQYNWNICPSDCNLKGFCVKSKCRCYTGFSGDACEVEDKEMKLFKIEAKSIILI
jgi:hypothetical protein